MKRFSSEILRRQLGQVFAAWGMPDDQAGPIIEVMVETDLRGIDSHGIAMLPLYEELRRQGKISPKPNLEVVRDTPVIGLIDADQGLGHLASVAAMNMAIEKAKAAGLSAVGVRNSNHFGAAGHYALMAARRGLVGMAFTNVWVTAMTPTRARQPMFGTNPIAFAAPAGRNPPFVLDMATTTVAIGKLTLAALHGRPIPMGWANDPSGKPVTDPNLALAERSLTPLGGLPETSSHKGYGLAAMVEVLCAMLTGAYYAPTKPVRHPDDDRVNIGHFFLCIDPNAFRVPGSFESELDDMIDALHDLSPADPDKPVLVAGDPENACYAERTAQGIPLPDTLLAQLRQVAEGLGIPFLLD